MNSAIRYIIAALAIMLAGPALAQSKPSNAKVGITNDNPQAVSVLDAGNVWATMGSVDKATHVFTPVGTSGTGGGPWPGTAGLDVGGGAGFPSGNMPFVNAYLANGLGVTTPLRVACPDGTTNCFSGGGGGSFTWPGSAGVGGPAAGTGGTMPFVNAYLNGFLPGFASPPTVNLGTTGQIATATNQTNGLQKSQVVDAGGNVLFASGRPGLIACPDGTTGCFSSSSTLVWPGTAGVATGGASTAGTMPYVTAYLGGALPAFASTPTVNIGTIGGTASAINQTNGNQVSRITSDGSNTLFGASVPGRIACPDGTTACFAGGGGGTFTWPGTAGLAGPAAGATGTMPFVNAYLNGSLPGFATPPTVNIGTAGPLATALNQTNGLQKSQNVDGSGNTLFVSGRPGLIACPDGTTGCFWPGTAGVGAGSVASAGTMPYVNAYLNGSLPAFAATPTFNIGTTAGIATANNQTNGNQISRVTSDGSNTLFGATTPGRIACPDGTTNCFAGGGGSGSNASVGVIGSAVPSSATYNGMLVAGGNLVGVSGSAWGTAPSGLNVLGVNANILANVLPPGAALAANQPALNGDGGANAHVTNFPATQAISATALPLPAGAATAANQPGLNADGGANAHVTNFPATQPVSAAALPLPAGASTSVNQTNGSQVSKITSTGSDTLFGATTPGRIACPDGTIACFAGGGGGTFTWPGTAGNAGPGAGTAGTMPFVNAYINGTLPGFTATPTFNVGTAGAIATAVNQTNGSQKTEIVDGAASILFVTGKPGLIACPDGTINCFWPGTAVAAAGNTASAGTMPYVNAYLNGLLPAFAATPTFNVGTAGSISTAVNQTNGGQKAQVVDPTGNTLFGATTPGRVACPDGTTSCFAGAASANVFQANIFKNGSITASGTTQIIAPVAGKVIYLVNYQFQVDGAATGAANFQILSGTGTGCVTSPTNLTQLWNFTANNGASPGSIGVLGASNSGDALCVSSTTATTTNKVNYNIGALQQ